jgi:hypothetical protein
MHILVRVFWFQVTENLAKNVISWKVSSINDKFSDRFSLSTAERRCSSGLMPEIHLSSVLSSAHFILRACPCVVAKMSNGCSNFAFLYLSNPTQEKYLFLSYGSIYPLDWLILPAWPSPNHGAQENTMILLSGVGHVFKPEVQEQGQLPLPTKSRMKERERESDFRFSIMPEQG